MKRKTAWKPAFDITSSPSVAKLSLTPTKEQQDIMAKAKQGNNIAIKAYAGAAKTSTCILVANELQKPSVYIAFNKSIAEEAGTKFPSHVECRTINSLAYRTIVDNHFRKKLQGFYQLSDLDTIMNLFGLVEGFTDEIEYNDIKQVVLSSIIGFCQSDTLSLNEYIKETQKEELVFHPKLLTVAVAYWEELINKHSSAKITHDVYLKLFQLGKPRLPYEVIYLDESQDSNPVTLDIVLSQAAYNTQIILVGDSYQAIYEWRGAVDALENLPDYFEHMYLTESFRFTQDIADMATKLTSILGNARPIIGRAKPLESVIDTKAIIVRNNSTMLNYLLELSETHEKAYVLADLQALWKKVYHISALYFKDIPRYPDPELKQYPTYAALLTAGESIPELKRLVNLTVQLSKGGLTGNINRIKSCIVDSPEKADITITTGHKSKGLEWDEIELADDLFEPGEDNDIDWLLENQNLQLCYVALTRAKYKVTMPVKMKTFIDNIEYAL